MKKSKIWVLAGISVVLLTGVWSGCSTSKAKTETTKTSTQTKTIYVATQNDYPPFDYVDASGKIIGYDVDVIKEINKQLPQYKFEFVTGPWATVVPSLQANKTQIIADQMNEIITSWSYFR